MVYFKKKKHYILLLILLLILLFLLMVFTATLGVAKIPFFECIKIILNKIPRLGRYISVQGITKTHRLIVLKIRLPRIFLSALVGMGLTGAGVVFQGIFKNPMADPYVLGISSGAALGAALAITFGIETIFMGLGIINIAAFCGAILTTFIVYNISKVGNKAPVMTLLLAGIALNFFLSSLISLIMTFNRNQVEKIVFWTMGSVAAADWNDVLISAPIIIISCLLLTIFSRDLNAMLMGEEAAKNLGIEVEKVKKILLIIATIIAASTVSVCGIIGFVGLIIPHAVRLIVGPDHRVLMPFSLFIGAIFMILSDTLARTLVPSSEIPVGVVTSLFGAPYFIYLLYRHKRKIIKR